MKLAALFSDHMVLQRDIAIPVWGWAEPGRHVTVEVAGNSAGATAGTDGKWLARLPALPAGGPHKLAVMSQGADSLVVTDVLVGEVWLASGQSNMNWPLSGALNAEAELARADHPQIRLFKVPIAAEVEPQNDTSRMPPRIVRLPRTSRQVRKKGPPDFDREQRGLDFVRSPVLEG